MGEEVLHLVWHTLVDTAKVAPILYLVYLVLEWAQSRWGIERLAKSRSAVSAPVVGALAGLVPQCGVSAIATFLYLEDILGLGCLLAVFLATSDEAIPLLFTHPDKWPALLGLLGVKFVTASLFGVLFALLFDRKKKTPPVARTEQATIVQPNAAPQPQENAEAEELPEDLPPATAGCDCGCCDAPNPFLAALWHTLKICFYVFVSVLLVQGVVLLVGEAALADFLAKGGAVTPVLAALVGLVPGCGTSVLITELYLAGGISFGALMAGLSSGAGFGVLLLLRSELKWHQKLLPIGLLFAAATLIGLFTDALIALTGLPL